MRDAKRLRIAEDLINNEKIRIEWAKGRLAATDASGDPVLAPQRRAYIEAINWHERTIATICRIFPELESSRD